MIDWDRLRKSLLRWYDRDRRDLPWRVGLGERVEPYRVLVSEAMLQQTQVATVVPYFLRFMEAFPTVEALASAEEGEVLRLWQGLGYYSRARRLHAAARIIVEQHGGRVPDTVEALLTLPGVGRYTAGAVASIAFGVAAPIVDGNIERVLTRVMLWDRPVEEAVSRERLWAWAGELAAGDRPGDVNQAVMELGATVCVPVSPACLLCPIAQNCDARAAGREEEVPVKGPRKAKREVVHEVVAIRRGGKYVLRQRAERGLWARMWEMPTREGEPIAAGDARRFARTPGASLSVGVGDWVTQTLGLHISEAERLGEFNHATTHRAIRFIVHEAEVIGGRLRPGAGRWHRLDRLDDLPLANPQRRAVAMVAAARGC